jgi:hypothetical protein
MAVIVMGGAGSGTRIGTGSVPETPAIDAMTISDGLQTHAQAGARRSAPWVVRCIGHVCPGLRFLQHSSRSVADNAPRQSASGAADNAVPWHTRTAIAYATSRGRIGLIGPSREWTTT